MNQPLTHSVYDGEGGDGLLYRGLSQTLSGQFLLDDSSDNAGGKLRFSPSKFNILNTFHRLRHVTLPMYYVGVADN